MSIGDTYLYKSFRKRLNELPNAEVRDNLRSAFSDLRQQVTQESSYIPLTFPEFTPHDEARHLAHLFALAERILGRDLLESLNAAEIVLLAFGILGHDWGMAVSPAEKAAITSSVAPSANPLWVSEQPAWQHFLAGSADGVSEAELWPHFVRQRHHLRSAARLRQALAPRLGDGEAAVIAQLAEGHGLDLRDIRDEARYPTFLGLFGQSANLAALAVFVRMLDLLDIANDRTPVHLWRFVAPSDPFSKDEWMKHRAISGVEPRQLGLKRQVVVSGVTDQPALHPLLEDLKLWVTGQFRDSILFLDQMPPPYSTDLDSSLLWQVKAEGFEPIAARFDPDRDASLQLFGYQLYQGDDHAWLRELLQNSVDAIDTRVSLQRRHGVQFYGRITVTIRAEGDGLLSVDWRDNGIGMDMDTVEGFLSKVGKSWYGSAAFLRKGLGQLPISRFGVGMLSCFSFSPSIQIETRRDPYYGGASDGLRITVPTNTSTFRIQRTSDVEVGTLVRLKSADSTRDRVTPQSIIDYLASCALMVEHAVEIHFGEDAYKIVPPSLVAVADSAVPTVLTEHVQFKIRSRYPETLAAMRDNTQVLAFEFGGPSAPFNGFFSCAVPRDLPALRIGDSSPNPYVFPDGSSANYYHVDYDGFDGLFTKGVLAGSFSTELTREAWDYRSEWMRPRLFVNVKDPSRIETDLARHRVTGLDTNLRADIWRAIADGLFEHLFKGGGEPRDVMLALATAEYFAGVPVEMLEPWAPGGAWPVLAIAEEVGLTWMTIDQLIVGGELHEAPLEICQRVPYSRDISAGPDWSWHHQPALVAWRSDFLGGVRRWEEPIRRHGDRIISKLGLIPSRLELVGEPDQWLELGAVWSYAEPEPHDPALVAELMRGNPGRPFPNSLNITVERPGLEPHFPVILDFPPPISEYAAIGSAYWNASHPKIRQLTQMFLQLHELRSRNALSRRSRQDMDESWDLSRYSGSAFYTTSTSASARVTVDRWRKMFDTCISLGIPATCEPLAPSDMVPGSLK